MLDKFMLGVTIEYQSGSVNSKGEERHSELIYGDIDLCKEAIDRADALGLKDSQLAIAFRENKDLEDLGGIEVQNEFIYEVTRAFLPDVDMSHIPLCWFRHYPAIEEEDDKKKEDKEVEVEEEDNEVLFAFELNMQPRICIERESGIENSRGSNSTHKRCGNRDNVSKEYNEETAIQSHSASKCIRRHQRENVRALEIDSLKIKKDLSSLSDNILIEIDRRKLPRINPICNQDIDYSR